MAEPVDWLADGTPASPRFGDRYRSSAAHGLDQARGVFLQGCGLPAAWAGQAQWRILETGFGLGLNFLVTWAAWRADAKRPQRLHFISCEAWPVSAQDLLRGAPPDAQLQALAARLAQQFHGLVPGVHRLAFEGGQVLLTLLIGDAQVMLKAQRPHADSVFLDGFAPPVNPDLWSPHTLKAVARCCRHGTGLATWSAARSVRDALTQCGFAVQKVAGVPPKRENLHAVYDPHWQPHATRPALPAVHLPAGRRCAVVGAGLAGAAVAWQLAQRGWQVTVLDAGAHPAAGASGVPAAIFAPHTSPDDSVISRLSRAGVRATLHALTTLAGDLQGSAWGMQGVLEHAVEHATRLAGDSDAWQQWTHPASTKEQAQAKRGTDAPALWHASAGWLRPAALIARLLAQPGITVRTGLAVAKIEAADALWRLTDAQGTPIAEADSVVVCAGPASAWMTGHRLPLQPVRGMASWGLHTPQTAAAPWPAIPVNGHGNLIPRVPLAGGEAWVCGSTFERDPSVLPLTESETAAAHHANFAKLQLLLPALAAALQPVFAAPVAPQLQAWSGVRCTTPDHLPLVGPLANLLGGTELPGLWICTGLGARGATLALLCAELLAARLHDEPLPLDSALARAIATERLARTAQSATAAAPSSRS